MTKLFILGISGYVGGDTLYAFAHAHPEWEITGLMRSPDKGEVVAKAYPAIKLVYGDLDNSDLLTEEASKADIVLQLADADHVGAIDAIFAGLQQTHTRAVPGYFIHMSGAGSLFPASILTDPSKMGTLPADTHIYDDWDGRVELYTRTPPNAFHKPADLAVTHAAERLNLDAAVRYALVSPPAIYGHSRGPISRESMIAPAQARIILTEGTGCLLGDGTNTWNVLHVSDVSSLLTLLVEAAVEGGGKADWGHDAYYLCEAGEMTQREFIESLTTDAARLGLIASTQLKPITVERANEITPYGALLLGSTSRGKSIRARKRLGWEPNGKSWSEEAPTILEVVAKEMGRWESRT